MKRNDMTTENIPTVISACCILHNLCEIHGETFSVVRVAPAVTTDSKDQEISLTSSAPDVASLGVTDVQPPVTCVKGEVTTVHNAI